MQSFTISVSPKIVVVREDCFNHGWTRINTDNDRFSLIRVHPCSSVVGSCGLRLRRAALYRRVALSQALGEADAWNRSDAPPNTIRRYGRLKICATTKRPQHFKRTQIPRSVRLIECHSDPEIYFETTLTHSQPGPVWILGKSQWGTTGNTPRGIP